MSGSPNLKTDADVFAAEIQRRGIQALIHFTPALNLTSIFECGAIISRHQLQLLKDTKPELYLGDYVETNDSVRLDNRPDFINLSIDFPNYRLFNVFKQKHKDVEDWAVILIKPTCITWMDTLFSVCNAASRSAKNHGIAGTYASFMNLFSESLSLSNMNRSWTEVRGDLDSRYPTSVQAEVLVKSRIPINYISSVAFQTDELAARFETAVQLCGGNTEGIPFVRNEHYFGSDINRRRGSDGL
jgi:hypothetical protein